MKSVVVFGLLALLVGLYLSTKNPLPPQRSRVTDPLTLPGESSSEWVNKRGVPMFLRQWTEVKDTVGVVFLFHGMGAHSGEATIRETANLLVKNGYHVFALDQAGHGRTPSDEDFGWVDDYNQWVEDGVAFIEEFAAKEQYKEKPFFIAGHSLGGTISIYLSLELQNRDYKQWAGSIFLAPAIQQSLSPSWIEIKLLEIVLALGGTKLPLGPGPNPSSFYSPEAFEEYVTDPWTYTKGVTLGFGWTALQMLEHLQLRLSTAKFPFLLLHCRDDPVTPLSGSQQLFQVSETSPDLKDLKVYENCGHGPLSWGDKQKPASDMLAWMKQRLADQRS